MAEKLNTLFKEVNWGNVKDFPQTWGFCKQKLRPFIKNDANLSIFWDVTKLNAIRDIFDLTGKLFNETFP